MKGWKYECYQGEFERWANDLPDGRLVEVYYLMNMDYAKYAPIKWEYAVYSETGNITDTFPDTCTTLDEKLAYAYTVARMS